MGQTLQSGFRPDIQGLRALAVIAVVIFHIKPSFLSGGYIGVDIFFTISGYLIISHIAKQMEKGSFSFVDFYCRRVKRLFPVLFVTCVLTSLFAYQLFLFQEFKDYIFSALSSMFYISNFWFYSQSGYFDSGLESSPLLHTWSLAVEEQFYILFPLILFLFFKVGKKWVPWGLTFIGLISLGFSELVLSFDSALSFYASPLRFWQFIAGGFISLYLKEIKINHFVSQIFGLSALIILLCCLFIYDGNTRFPGVSAIIPTLATCYLLMDYSNGALHTKLLSIKPAVFIGNISYSFYLWHWPTIVFYKILYLSTNVSKLDAIILFLSSLLLGWVSYTFIEQKFRYINIGNKDGPRIIGASLVLTAIFSITLLASDSLHEKKFTKQQKNYETFLTYDTKYFRSGSCFLTSGSNSINLFDRELCISVSNVNNVLLIGDSHAAHFYASLRSLLPNYVQLSQANSSGCAPVFNASGPQRCKDMFNWIATDLVKNIRFDAIIVSARWSNYIEYIEKREYLLNTLQYLKKYTDNLILIGPTIEYKLSLPYILAIEGDHFSVSDMSNLNIARKVDRLLIQMSENLSVNYVSLVSQLCEKNNNCKVTANEVPITFDYGHFTKEGADFVLKTANINELVNL
ncbi:acyltransferase family protein [Gayadomonas joobiniege]|uniref:acyltransferase family protein n=1 Tax=Gayadomonas joobiniege TaxID=1234606 RepID=UPI00035D4F14|nr:acyltransferase family protein [Gayadomonas joobiniege]